MRRSTNPLAEIVRLSIEEGKGRIRRIPNTWAFVEQVPKRTKIYPSVREFKDERGVVMVLTSQRGTYCPNPDMADKHPQMDAEKNYSIPYSLCQKCEHHRKAVRGTNYPCCMLRDKQSGGILGAIKKTGEMVQTAYKEAANILEGKVSS